MDVSMVISSFNQKKRLKFCLDSISKQEGDFDYEIILADDNSTDGTLEFVKEEFPQVIVSLNEKSKPGKYTLADNWNSAVKLAKGTRVVFSNGDLVFSKNFLESHLDPIMQDGIIFGPCYSSAPAVDSILTSCETAKEIVRWLGWNNLIGKDRHAEGSADTYNKTWDWWFPFGGNFSVLRKHFNGVGGFPSFEKWGQEDTQLCKKIVEKYKVPVKSNKNTVSIHLWHPRVNHENMAARHDDINF